MQRGKGTAQPVVEGSCGGRLPRPHSAIITRESAMVTTTPPTTSPPPQQSVRDDVVTTTTTATTTTTTTAASLLSVPSSWYRTEVATNVGPGSRRLTANVQLGLPQPITTSVTSCPAEVFYPTVEYLFLKRK